MYEKIKNGLIFPNRLHLYAKERGIQTFLYIIILILILALPNFIKYASKDKLGPNAVSAITKTFKEADVVQYEIDNGKLLKKDDSVLVTSINIDELLITVAFGDGKVTTTNGNLLIRFSENGVFLSTAVLQDVLFPITDYSTITEKVDFSLAKAGDEKTLLQIFNFVNNYIKDHKVGIIAIIGYGFLIGSAVELLFIILMISGISAIFSRSYGAKYKEIFKIVTACSLPLVIMNLIGVLLNSYIWFQVGYFIILIYALIALRSYRIEQFLKNGGK